jgi:IS5 family transposase
MIIFKKMKHNDLHLFFDERRVFDQILVPYNRLISLKKRVDFEAFLPVLNEKLGINESVKQNADKWTALFLFKCVLLGIIFDYGDEELEYQIKNRADFKNFLDLGLLADSPDQKTLWDFREKLVKSGAEKALFDSFLDEIKLYGYSFDGERIVDGTMHECERRNTSKKVDEMIKEGNIPEKISNNLNVLAQNDLDASWKKKGKESFFGYLGLIIVLSKYKLITNYCVDSAHVDERKNVPALIREWEKQLRVVADKGFVGEAVKEEMKKLGIDFIAMEKEYLYSPDILEIIKSNNLISKIRSRVEHVFGNIVQMFPQRPLRQIGLERNSFRIGMMYMLHNMFRIISIENDCA